MKLVNMVLFIYDSKNIKAPQCCAEDVQIMNASTAISRATFK